MVTHIKKSKTTPKQKYATTLVAADSVWSDKNISLRRAYLVALKALQSRKAKNNSEYRAKNEKTLRDASREFYLLNQGLIHAQAKMFHRNHDSDNDNVAAAAMGLWEAFTKFDPERGVAFSTFSRQYIAGALQRTVRRNEFSHLSQAEFNLRKQVRLAEAQLCATMGKTPSYEEIAKYSGVPLDKVMRTYSTSAASLDVAVDEEGHTLGALLESIEEVVDVSVALEDYVGDLNDLEYWVIGQRYGSYSTEAPSLLEVASLLGLGREIIRRAETRAKVRLVSSYLTDETGNIPTNSEIAKQLKVDESHVEEYRRLNYEDLRSRLSRAVRAHAGKATLDSIGREFMYMSSATIAEIMCRYTQQDNEPISEKESAQQAWIAFEVWSPSVSNYATHLKKELAKSYKYAYTKVDKSPSNYHILWSMVTSKQKV